MSKKLWQKMLSLLLALCLVATWGGVICTDAAGIGNGLRQVSSDRIHANPFGREPVNLPEEELAYADTDIVRVSIILDDAGALDAGYAAEDIADNEEAMQYRNALKVKQDVMTDKIGNAIGQELEVVWNLTLAANIISANVPYGKISAIKGVKGIQNVVLETQYQIDLVEKGINDPNMITSSMQIGSTAAYAAGLTGAGSRIAIIDTGLDVEHISFDPDAFLYSLSKQAEFYEMELNTYLEGLELLDEAEIADVLPSLNMYAMADGGVTAADLFVNEKVPFGFNYVDVNTEITHMKDTEGEHGSHVAGIAAANAYVPGESGYDEALDTVLVQGVAPDAQLMVMKVFGQNGGAYDADYMVAIEDAIMLGADAVNLSLGSTYPGASASGIVYYNTIFDNLEKSGVVVTISAGNSGSFADYTPYGLMFLDDPNVQTGGSPGTYTNSLGVASAENIGYSGEYMYVGPGYLCPFTEPDGYSNAPIGTIAGENEYVYLFGIGTPEEFDALLETMGLESFEGKVVLCDRGLIDFSAKANAAVERGAKGVIIVNTEDTLLNMVLEGYNHTAPVAMVSALYGQLFSMTDYGATIIQDGEGNPVSATGVVEINDGPVAGLLYENSEMSTFSSWGVPGDLSMKPEITAPGGLIYSVAGAINTGNGYFYDDHASYEAMGGTSMAAPQVAGMAALLAQYIKQNGLEEKTGLDARTLAQSLLMSTAEPMLSSANDYAYYSVRQQGAGLANVGNAILANSYILMDADATDAYADGKVKAELGDDPTRSGQYTFSFYIHNLTNADEDYQLAADFFTQAPANVGLNDFVWYFDATAGMAYNTTWTVDGEPSDGVATVPANGSVKVTVKVELDPDEIAFMDNYYDGGCFIEGFVYAIGENTPEGEAGTIHSIPVLGYYGSWTDASMYDNGSYMEYSYGMESQLPYLYEVNWESGLFNSLFYSPSYDPAGMYYFGGNPMIFDGTYMPERNAINSAYPITTVGFTAIRSGAAGFVYVMNTETGATRLQPFAGAFPDNPAAIVPAFYSNGQWQLNYSMENVLIDFTAYAEGTELEVGVLIVPEYYVDDEGNVDFAALGDGAFFSMQMTVDNTAPTASQHKIDGDTLTVTATDNQYVSAVVLTDITGSFVLAETGSDPNATAGTAGDFVLDISDVDTAGFLIGVYDYAGNVTVYEVDENIGETTDTIDSVTVSPEVLTLNMGTEASVTASILPINANDRTYTWSSSDETVVIVKEDGTVLPVGTGTATITATANADSTKTGTCEVVVVDIHKTLNAVVWDENGSIYFSEFSTDTMPTYKKLSPDMLETDYITSVAVTPDGTIYASSMDTESQTLEGTLYTVNPITWKVTPVASLTYGMTDMTYAPNMYGHGALVGTFGGNVITYDPVTGELMDVPDFFDGATLIGIANVYSAYNEKEEKYEDHFIYIDNEGNVYYEVYYSWVEGGEWLSKSITSNEDESHTPYMATGVDKSGGAYFNSVYYDKDTNLIFWTAFDETVDNNVTLYAIDLENKMTIEVGQFAEAVWPVGGLFEMPCLHEHTELKNVAEATCVSTGYTGDLYCSDCDKLLEKGEETKIDPDNHEMGEWTETKPTSCSDEGEEKRECQREGCEHFETREIPKEAHDYKSTVTAPTTKEEGYTTHTCQVCGHNYKDTYTDKLVVDPDNSDTGEYMNTYLLTAMLVVSVAGMAVLVTFRKKFSV